MDKDFIYLTVIIERQYEESLLGLSLKYNLHNVIVDNIDNNGLAKKSGIKLNDRIISINGTILCGLLWSICHESLTNIKRKTLYITIQRKINNNIIKYINTVDVKKISKPF